VQLPCQNDEKDLKMAYFQRFPPAGPGSRSPGGPEKLP
jgi:hypothetical protein